MVSLGIKFLGKVENVLAIVLAPLTLAIVLTWNSQASETFYPLKQALEKVISLFF